MNKIFLRKIKIKHFIIIALSSYLIGLILGLSQDVGLYDVGQLPEAEKEFDKLFFLTSENKLVIFKTIALSNMELALIEITFGIISLGIIPIIIMFYNGFTHGLFFNHTINFISVDEIIKSTIPHSPEILGLTMACALGFALSSDILFGIKIASFKKIIYLFVTSIAIIIISAFIETFISIS